MHFDHFGKFRPNLVVFGQKRKILNSATRRRQIHPTSLKIYLFAKKKLFFGDFFFVDTFIHEISR